VVFALALAIWPIEAAADMRLGSETGGATTFKVVSWRDMPFRTVVRQQYDYSCGSAALATLLHHHYGIALTEADIFRAMYDKGDQEKIRKVGFSLLDMKNYLEDHGLRADGFRMSLDAFAKTQTPAIVLIDLGGYKHFVVVKGLDKARVLIGDPALGLKTFSRAEFEKMWNGIIFAIPKTSDRSSFNRDDEWETQISARLDNAELSRPIDQMTREIEPTYQLSPIFSLDWALQQ
jgi:predicted double-glycine peptidase